jgi:hypothetical protein
MTAEDVSSEVVIVDAEAEATNIAVDILSLPRMDRQTVVVPDNVLLEGGACETIRRKIWVWIRAYRFRTCRVAVRQPILNLINSRHSTID